MSLGYYDQQVDWIDGADSTPSEGLVFGLVKKLKTLSKQGFEVLSAVPVIKEGKSIGLLVVSRRASHRCENHS